MTRHPPLFYGLRLTLLFVVGSLSACASPGFDAEVTRFHTLPQPNGESLLIEPLDAAQAGIEFASYADLIGARLGEAGYVPAKVGEPGIIAGVGYEVIEVAPLRRNSGTSIGIGVGGGSRHVGGGLGTSFDLSGGPKPEYLRRLTLIMTDQASGQRLFEGRVESRGRTPDLAAAMPYLVDALFDGFPGQSGATTRVKLDIDR